MSIRPLFPLNTPPIEGASARSATQIAEPEGAGSFGETIANAIASVDGAQREAARGAGEMAAGTKSLDEALITIEKADLGFRLLTQVRNKVVDAYREMMRVSF